MNVARSGWASATLADVSASVADAQPDLATFISQAVTAKTPDDVYAVVTTARTAAVVQDLSRVALPFSGASTSEAGPASDATDLAAGLRPANNPLPGGSRPPPVPLPSGQETS